MATIAQWNFTSDGTSSVVTYEGTNPFQIEASGTFGSGTVVVSSSLDGGTTFINLTNASFTENARAGAYIPSRGEKFKATLTGSTTPNLNVFLVEVVKV